MFKRFGKKLISLSITCALVTGISACGSGDGNILTAGRGGSDSTLLTLSVTDAAVDSAREVWVQFTGVTIQPADGDAIEFTFDTVKNIDLLSLQGTRYSDLISNESVPLGNYDWTRLHVNATEDGILDSYIVLDDGSEHELDIPSGSQTGLKINTGYEVVANQNLNLMIDFDLRKSVVESSGDYKLRPTLRLVDVSNTGTISGTIDASLLTGPSCSDGDLDTGNAVYVFEGENATLDDVDNSAGDLIASALVELNASTGDYEYVVGFVPAGDYTVAFTCEADNDRPDRNDDITFVLTENVSITADNGPSSDPMSR